MKNTKVTYPLADKHAYFLLACLIFIVFFSLSLKNQGFYPMVFADEYTYSRLSRKLDLIDSNIPGYIYLLLYSITSYCGDGFLGCARLVNSFFFSLSLLPIFFIAKKIDSNWMAWLVCVFTFLSGLSSYVAYFMPESMFFFGFWVFSWIFLNLDERSKIKKWLLAGVIYGVLSLVKPHAVLFSPALACYIIFIHYKKSGAWVKNALSNGGLFLFFGFATKFFLGFLLADLNGLTLFGSSYTSMAAPADFNVEKFNSLLLNSFENFVGHFLVLALLYGTPLLLALNAILPSISREVKSEKEKISFFFIFILFNMVIATALFTAVAVNSGPFESLYRLHSRYYNFTLPFVLIVIGGWASNIEIKNRNISLIVWVIFVFCSIYALFYELSPFVPGIIDSPEIYGFTHNRMVFYIIGVLSLFVLMAAQFYPGFGAKLYFLCVALPAAICSFYYISIEHRSHLVPDSYDSAGAFARNIIPEDEMHRVLVVGAAPAGLYKTLFHMDYPASLEVLNEGDLFDLSKVPQDKDWVVYIGQNQVVGNYIYKNALAGVTVYRIRGSNSIDFKQVFWPGVVLSSNGLSTPESWGTWSNAERVHLELAEILPSNFKLKIVAIAFGPNVGRDFVVKIGSVTKSFSIESSDKSEVELRFSDIRNSKIIEILIPEPVSPKDLGISGDQRRLGIGLLSMKIVPE